MKGLLERTYRKDCMVERTVGKDFKKDWWKGQKERTGEENKVSIQKWQIYYKNCIFGQPGNISKNVRL